MNIYQLWNVVYTRPDCEQKVARQLSRYGMECYCPLTRTTLPYSKRIRYKPLFPQMIFVQLNKNDYKKLKRIPGVINLAYWLQEPAVLPEAELALIRYFLSEYVSVQMEKIPVNFAGTVQMFHPEAWKGTEPKPEKNSSYQLLLPSLGYALFAKPEHKVGQNKNNPVVFSANPGFTYVTG